MATKYTYSIFCIDCGEKTDVPNLNMKDEYVTEEIVCCNCGKTLKKKGSRFFELC